MSPRPVHFAVSCEAAYDYLIDPDNRALWQSSLRGVSDVFGDNGVVGQSWTDRTVGGLHPRMELTDADRPHRWTEKGTWRSFSANLTLTYVPVGDGCDVTPSMQVLATGPARAIAAVLDRFAPYAVRSDLKRAAKLLAR